MAFGLATVEGFAVQKAFKVDVHGVAHFGRALHRQHARVALLDALNLIVNRLVRDRLGSAERLDTLVVAENDFGIGGNVKGKFTGLFIRHIDIGDAGLADHTQLAFLHAERKGFRGQIVHRVLIKDFLPVHALDHLTRGLALAEAGNVNVLLVFQISAVDGLFKFGRIRGYGKHCGIVLFFLDILQNHEIISSSSAHALVS